MSEESIFNGEDPAVVVENPAPQFSLPQEVAELVGEGRKYKSAEDALKSIPHAQSHIQKLEEEMKEMREELAKRKAAEELLEELKATGLPKADTPSTQPVDIEQVVSKVLSQKEQAAVQRANQKKVVEAFDSKYGEKGEEMYVSLSKELGMSVAELNMLAARSPSALFKMAGFDVKTIVPTKTSSSVNTEGFNQSSQDNFSAKLPKGATTKDLVQAWRNAGEKVKQRI